MHHVQLYNSTLMNLIKIIASHTRDYSSVNYFENELIKLHSLWGLLSVCQPVYASMLT